MSGKKSNSALMVAVGMGMPIALNASGDVAEWIMLMPAGVGGVIATVDGRGPYRLGDARTLAEKSLQAAGGRLPIDENHATDLAAPNGGPSPARGWATALDVRADGIWGRVEWSAPGKALLSEHAYRFISPAFTHDDKGNITALLRASLTNTPNLRGMAALNAQENEMDLLAQLRKLLGLADDADEAAVIAKITAMTKEPDPVAVAAILSPIAKAVGLKDGAGATAIATAVTALKSGTALASIAKAVGLKDDADVAAITAAVTQLAAGGNANVVVSLQAQLADVTTKLNSLTESTAKDKATAFVDNAIKEGRVGLKPLRDHYIAMHAQDSQRVEKEIGAMAIIGPGNRIASPPPKPSGNAVDLSDSVALAAAGNLLINEQAKLGVTLTISDAVTIIKERQS